MKANFTTKKNRNYNYFLSKKLILYTSIILSFNVLYVQNMKGQTSLGSFQIEAVNLNSDWYVKLKVPDKINGNMWCHLGGEVYSWRAYLDGDQISSANQKFNDGGGFITPNLQSNGIDKIGNYHMRYYVNGNFGCSYYKTSNTIQVSTVPLKAPVNLVATDSTSLEGLKNNIKITWGKGTDVPDGIHHYYIARDFDFENKVHITGTSPREWTDTDVGPGETHSYSIWTWVSSSTWGGHQSDTITVEGSTFPNFIASDGEVFSKTQVRISWPPMPEEVKSVKILKEGVEIANITDMAATRIFYDENEVIPGFKYNYSLVPMSENTEFPSQNDTGFARPNGRIQGSVKAPFGGPVEGAIVYAERIDSIPQGEVQIMYSDTTNASGAFDIRNIYYYQEARFNVYAEKGDHGFNPASHEVTLDLTYPALSIASPSFVDTSSFTVTGRVAQILGNDSAAVEEVQILVNDLYKGTTTNNLGEFSLTVDEIGEYTIKPQYLNHTFVPSEITLQIETDVTSLFFEDTAKDTLSGYFLGACDIYIGQAAFRIFNSKNPSAAFDTTIVTAETSGYYEVVLPSREYNIEFTGFTPASSQTLSKEEIINYFGVSEVDLSENSVQKNYIYRKPPEIEIVGWPENGCAPYEVPIVEQIVKYPLEIRVFESYGDETCLTSSGYVVVYDEVKDGYEGPDTLYLEGGVAKYELLPGEPNILSGGEHPYQKMIAFHANVDGQKMDLIQYVLVEGNRPREQTFATVSPEVPFMILRDPPGDGSYSFLSENTTTQASMTFFAKTISNTKAWAEVKVGAKTLQGMGVLVGSEFWATIKGSFEVGAELNSTTEFGLSISNTEEFNTSANPNITGESGDLFIGSAMNIIYALTDVIAYNKENCSVEPSTDIIVGTDGFATTFMYTDSHIRNVLIPDLERLENIYQKQDNDSSILYTNQIDVWRQTLERNQEIKQKAIKINNRSFSAGSDFKSSIEVSTTASISLGFSLFIESNIALESGIEIAGNGYQGGVETKFRMEYGASSLLSSSYKRTTGFQLQDDDIGDFFSVDIKADPVYGTPVFGLVSGRSSCPWEPGTQPREGVQLTIDKPVQSDIEQDAQAVFKLNLGNTSQSDEDRDYMLVFLQESNPEGATIKLAGSEVQGGSPVPYSIIAGSSIEQTVEVWRGPQSNAYQDLRFVMFSDCDAGSISDTVSFSVYFKSNCSEVAITKPLNNWILNGNSNNTLPVEISGYGTENLNNIVLQYRNLKTGYWELAQILQKSDLQNTSTVINWDVTTLQDGEYEIRAQVTCGDNNLEISYSEIITGRIDRMAPALFGVPEPSDGRYDNGDIISAKFNEAVNCSNFGSENVILENILTGTVYSTEVGCAGREIVIVPLTDEEFTNQSLRVSLIAIEDQFGNVRADTIQWEFDITNANFVVDNETDSDGDGIVNNEDNCPYTPNPDQADQNENGIGDACETTTAIENVETNDFRTKIYPNPASAEVRIELELPDDNPVIVKLLDINGVVIKNILEKATLGKGMHNISENVQSLAKGLYLVQVITKSESQTHKLLIIK